MNAPFKTAATEIAEAAGEPFKAERIARRLNARQRLVERRREEIVLAACALSGICIHRGPITHAHQAIVMGHLDALFGFTPAESAQASDMLFEATLNHSIHDSDRPRIEKLANKLTIAAKDYDGSDCADRELWAAGYELFEVDSLFDASQPPETDRYDPVFDNTAASLRYFDRI